jgi:hypothetical protein
MQRIASRTRERREFSDHAMKAPKHAFVNGTKRQTSSNSVPIVRNSLGNKIALTRVDDHFGFAPTFEAAQAFSAVDEA